MGTGQGARMTRDHVSRTLVQSKRGYKGTRAGRILVDQSIVKSAIPHVERTSLHPTARYLSGVQVDTPAGKASKRDLSATWGKGRARVIRRKDAELLAIRDATQFDPAYQIGRLRHNLDVMVRQAAKAIQAGTPEGNSRYERLCSKVADTRAKIQLLADRLSIEALG